MKLSEIEEGSVISIRVLDKEKKLYINGTLKKHLKPNIAMITLSAAEVAQKLSFDSIRADLEFTSPEGEPYIWYKAKIVHYKGDDYAMQVFSDGTKHNRRGFFRVGVSAPARVKNAPKGSPHEVMMRDVSMTGFSIADRKKEFSLSIGDVLSVYWEDFGLIMDLTGRVVRIEEQEEFTVYGFEISNVCKDLAAYISRKQRQRK